MAQLLGVEYQFTIDTRERPFEGSECVIVVLEDAEEPAKMGCSLLLQLHQFLYHAWKGAEIHQAMEENRITGIPKLKRSLVRISHNEMRLFDLLPTRQQAYLSYITTRIDQEMKSARDNELPSAT
ncbi:uncharacterized protein MCYG_02511 [Microsporum canis CBS 113480]|uniref:Uncharacterized protein n=1 Tax=Arthroderma otae (strain ATCC MYA-4605 / CBS 113480) TaxID=554155 RepID=C5FG07_ARTOC|nr:uncharacterized protein MCYG_02511 [Microsporum canis CBS 113480]EEQ29692.1 predicted protein [Microsporum canis CBS 113480]